MKVVDTDDYAVCNGLATVLTGRTLAHFKCTDFAMVLMLMIRT